MFIGLNTTSAYSRSNSCPISLDAMCPFPSATLDKQERGKKISAGKNTSQFGKKTLLSSVLMAISNNY